MQKARKTKVVNFANQKPSDLDKVDISASLHFPPSSTTTASAKHLRFSGALSPQFDSRLLTQSVMGGGKAQLRGILDDLPNPSTSPKPTFKFKRPARARVVLQSLNFTKGFQTEESDDDSDAYRHRLATPYQQERVITGDEGPQQMLGEEAVGKFYSHYRNLDRINDINEFNQTKNAMYTSFLRKSEDLKLLPSKIGLIKHAGPNDGLKINHYRIGDQYASVLSEGLRSATNFHKFELSHNRLSSVGADILLSTLSNRAESIDLSGNNIGKMGCQHLCQLLKLKNPRLQDINLESNKLGDYAMVDLCEALADSDTVVKLNLNKNFLTNKGAETIGKMLQKNSSIEELYLNWNQIKGPGGIALIEGIEANRNIKVLDLSWNSLGTHNSSFPQKFADFIVKDKILVHLDLSNNFFGKISSQIIATALEKNHSLYGLHFQGNAGYVDCKGFLVIPEDFCQDISAQTLVPHIKGTKVLPESLKRYQNHSGEFTDVCWICEGWRPIEIKWTPGSSGLGDQDPIYVHFSYEGYKSRFLPKTKEFQTKRMAPPISFNYLFSVDDYQTFAEDHPSEQNSKLDLKIIINEKVKVAQTEFLNCIHSTKPLQILDSDFRPEDVVDFPYFKPRVQDDIYIPPEVLIERPIWKFPVSIFRDYRPDTQALLDKCFEVDFEGTRISKLVKNEEDLKSVREMLHSIYKPLKDCYKHFAAIGAPSEIWSIPLNTYTDFCSYSGIIDGKILKLADFDRIFIATYTKTEKDKNPRNPDRALVRYQFMEGLIRIADQKYLGNGTANTYTEALKMLLDESVNPFINKFDHQKWRLEKYWNEQVDAVLKSYLPILKGVYKKYSGLKTLPGQKKFMSLEEFFNLMNDTGMFNDNCGDRDATIAFSIAMMTQVDELGSDRIYQMQFIEFLEALARVADKYSAAPYRQNEAEIPYEERAAQPLYIKLEGLIEKLFEACGSDVKDIWILPETSVFEMEEVHGKQRFTTKKKKIMRIDPTDPVSVDAYDC